MIERTRAKVSENITLREYLYLRGIVYHEAGKIYTMTSYIICNFHHILLAMLKQKRARWTSFVKNEENKSKLFFMQVKYPLGSVPWEAKLITVDMDTQMHYPRLKLAARVITPIYYTKCNFGITDSEYDWSLRVCTILSYNDDWMRRSFLDQPLYPTFRILSLLITSRADTGSPTRFNLTWY